MNLPRQSRWTSPRASLQRWMVRLVAALSILAFSLPSNAWACPTCKNDLHHSGTDFGFAVSILFMMAAPFCIFVGWAVVIYRLRKQMMANDSKPFDVVHTNATSLKQSPN